MDAKKGTLECVERIFPTYPWKIFNFHRAHGSVAFDRKEHFYIEMAIQFQPTIDAVNTQRGYTKSIGQTAIFSHIRWFIFYREIPIGPSVGLIFDYDVLKNLVILCTRWIITFSGKIERKLAILEVCTLSGSQKIEGKEK